LEGGVPWIEVMGADQGENTVESVVVSATQFGIIGVAVKLPGEFPQASQIEFPSEKWLFLFQLSSVSEGFAMMGKGGGQSGSDLENRLDFLQFGNAGATIEDEYGEEKN